MPSLDDEIYKYLNGLDDNGSAISFGAESHEKSFGANFEDILQIAQIEIEIIKGNNVGVWGAFDGGQFRPLGFAKRGINRITVDVDPGTDDYPRCQKLTLALREMSKSALAIGTLAVLYYETKEEESFRD